MRSLCVKQLGCQANLVTLSRGIVRNPLYHPRREGWQSAYRQRCNRIHVQSLQDIGSASLLAQDDDAIASCLDSAVADLSYLFTFVAYKAAQELWPERVVGAVGLYVEKARAILPVLVEPHHAVILVRLLCDEGVIGARSTAGREGPVVGRAVRQSGSRPLLVAEIAEHWPVVMDSCLLRWSLEMTRGSEQPHTGPGQCQGLLEQRRGGGSNSRNDLLARARVAFRSAQAALIADEDAMADCLARVNPHSTAVVEALKGSSRTPLTLATTLPPALGLRVLERCGLADRPAGHLDLVSGPSWPAVVSRVVRRAAAGGGRLQIVTGNLARLEQLVGMGEAEEMEGVAGWEVEMELGEPTGWDDVDVGGGRVEGCGASASAAWPDSSGRHSSVWASGAAEGLGNGTAGRKVGGSWGPSTRGARTEGPAWVDGAGTELSGQASAKRAGNMADDRSDCCSTSSPSSSFSSVAAGNVAQCSGTGPLRVSREGSDAGSSCGSCRNSGSSSSGEQSDGDDLVRHGEGEREAAAREGNPCPGASPVLVSRNGSCPQTNIQQSGTAQPSLEPAARPATEPGGTSWDTKGQVLPQSLAEGHKEVMATARLRDPDPDLKSGSISSSYADVACNRREQVTPPPAAAAPSPTTLTSPWPTLRAVHLAEWSCSNMSYKARALSYQPRASLLSEHQLAEWLGVTHLDIVMDGVAWR